MASRLHGDEGGATLIEFTVILPMLLILTMGLVDLGLLMFNWADADRATQRGARFAATNDPVAAGINVTVAGKGGAVSGTACTSATCVLPPRYDCIASKGSGGTCTGTDGSTKSIVDGKFDAIVGEMNDNMYSRTLDRRQIRVSYIPLMQGYVGRPSTPMNVSVSLRCTKQQLFFVDAFLGWIFPPLPDECGDIPDPGGLTMSFVTTVPSEDLSTN